MRQRTQPLAASADPQSSLSANAGGGPVGLLVSGINVSFIWNEALQGHAHVLDLDDIGDRERESESQRREAGRNRYNGQKR
jgi:hypothetical protein